MRCLASGALSITEALPFCATNAALTVQVEQSKSSVVQEDFSSLEADSISDTVRLRSYDGSCTLDFLGRDAKHLAYGILLTCSHFAGNPLRQTDVSAGKSTRSLGPVNLPSLATLLCHQLN